MPPLVRKALHLLVHQMLLQGLLQFQLKWTPDGPCHYGSPTIEHESQLFYCFWVSKCGANQCWMVIRNPYRTPVVIRQFLGFITTLLRKSRNWIWYITVALNRFEKNLITTDKTIGSLPRPTSSLRFKKTRTSGFLILKYFKNWNHRIVTKSNTHPTMEQTWRPKLRNFGTYVHNSFLQHY